MQTEAVRTIASPAMAQASAPVTRDIHWPGDSTALPLIIARARMEDAINCVCMTAQVISIVAAIQDTHLWDHLALL